VRNDTQPNLQAATTHAFTAAHTQDCRPQWDDTHDRAAANSISVTSSPGKRRRISSSVVSFGNWPTNTFLGSDAGAAMTAPHQHRHARTQRAAASNAHSAGDRQQTVTSRRRTRISSNNRSHATAPAQRHWPHILQRGCNLQYATPPATQTTQMLRHTLRYGGTTAPQRGRQHHSLGRQQSGHRETQHILALRVTESQAADFRSLRDTSNIAVAQFLGTEHAANASCGVTRRLKGSRVARQNYRGVATTQKWTCAAETHRP
jgi:hypothetical protein